MAVRRSSKETQLTTAKERLDSESPSERFPPSQSLTPVECPSGGSQAAESSEESSLTISVVHRTGLSTSKLQPMLTLTVAPSRLGPATVRPKGVGPIRRIQRTINGSMELLSDLLLAAVTLTMLAAVTLTMLGSPVARHWTFPTVNGATGGSSQSNGRPLLGEGSENVLPKLNAPPNIPSTMKQRSITQPATFRPFAAPLSPCLIPVCPGSRGRKSARSQQIHT
ncbi:hypothetical protein B0O99DRAFT_602274 [Bisporella sp. PMI_857]|nr:hypothetical protein B0O99DRAFT_602274 [Bisporella sp. PMI_857]